MRWMIFILFISTSVSAVDLSGARIAGARFDAWPLSLFSEWRADIGAWQDASATVPCASGDPIYTITASGGSFNLTQAAQLKRPTYQSGLWHFDGASQYISASAASDWEWTYDSAEPGFTLFCSFEDSAPLLTGPRVVVSTAGYTSNELGWSLHEDSLGRLEFNMSNGTSFVQNAGRNGSLIPGFNVVAIRWSPSSGLDAWNGGMPFLFSAPNLNPAQSGSASSPLRLGCRGNTESYYFSGTMGDLMVYKRFLRTNEILWVSDQLARRRGSWASRFVDVTGNSAFPHAIKLQNGQLAAVYASGGTSETNMTHIKFITSSDLGRTWSSPTTNFLVANPYVNDPCIVQLSNGNIVLTSYYLTNAGSSVLHGAWTSVSSDMGSTWSPVYNIVNDGVTDGSTYCSAPAVQLDDGTLRFGVYTFASGHTYGTVYVVSSTDGGMTWGSPILVADGQLVSQNYTEPNLVVTGSTSLKCLIRDTTSNYIVVSSSTDSGNTWSAASNAFLGRGSPHTVKCSDGNFICVSRGVTTGAREMAKWSNDLVSWNTNEITFDAGGNYFTSVMYGTPVELSAGIIGILYCMSSPVLGSTCGDVRWATFKETDFLAYP